MASMVSCPSLIHTRHSCCLLLSALLWVVVSTSNLQIGCDTTDSFKTRLHRQDTTDLTLSLRSAYWRYTTKHRKGPHGTTRKAQNG